MEPTPKNLYLTAAMLIREGFITLEDLYQHVRSLATRLCPAALNMPYSYLRPTTRWRLNTRNTLPR